MTKVTAAANIAVVHRHLLSSL